MKQLKYALVSSFPKVSDVARYIEKVSDIISKKIQVPKVSNLALAR